MRELEFAQQLCSAEVARNDVAHTSPNSLLWQELRHAVSPKLLVQLSMAAAGAVAFLTVLDLALAIPFGRAMIFDIMFLISSGIVLYLGWESYRELT